MPCHDIDFCLEEETCSIVGRQLFSSEVRTSKCISKHACRDQTGSHVSIIGKRDDAFAKRTQQHTCDLCCHDDLCNRNCLTASNIPDKDECTSNPCGFGGTCFDAINGYNCVCAPGFSGLNCEIDIDECISNPCGLGGTCFDAINGYNCVCAPGFTGVNCETDIDDCLFGLCGTYGTCIDGINSYTCACEMGFTGNYCEINIDECAPNPCGSGGTCFDAINGYNCVCAPGYSGVNCEIDIDDCLIGLCGTHGTCNDKLNGYMCMCAPGFTGNNCETKLTATDCTDVLHQSFNPSNGVYNVTTWKTHRTIQVYCDMTTAGGGWTVFQNRFDGSVTFTRSFSEYVNGFGDIHKEFWLGLENLHELVSQGNYELRIDVTAANGSKGYETFPNFTISAGSNYTLHISPGHGSIGDNAQQGMSFHNGMPFSTFDHKNTYQCAQTYKSGWWYNRCMFVHLNGVYFSPGTIDDRAMFYNMFTQGNKSLQTSRMMFRKV
ncbi:fibropellin-1-like [Ruditapes philippinarum]|uniref:fibropellin-1-like n=1 Tax=Ruditapes philippinarum TaxID=129788 RepID=UPI00295A9E80|nr:fibropellin-1-like [Ruditapes philippinarum]